MTLMIPGIADAQFISQAAPTLIQSMLVLSSSANGTGLTSPSFTPAIGEVIIVKGATEDSGSGYTGVPTSTGMTFAQLAVSNAASNGWGAIWGSTTTANTARTVSSSALTGNPWHSMIVERWGSAKLAATPATNSTKTGSGTPSAVVVTAANESIITSLNIDWNALSPAARAYLASAIEDGIHDKSTPTSQYVAEYFYQLAAAAGNNTFGLSAPGGEAWTLLGVEIQAL